MSEENKKVVVDEWSEEAITECLKPYPAEPTEGETCEKEMMSLVYRGPEIAGGPLMMQGLEAFNPDEKPPMGLMGMGIGLGRMQAINQQPATPAKTVTCPACNAEVVETSKFCTECGAIMPKREKFCSCCGAKVDTAAKFCIECGQKL